MAEDQDLYKVLGVARDASQAEIRKAYHRLALQLHPDKNQGDEAATQKFQSLKQIYAVLGDADKRRRYDQTGSLGDAEELSSQSFDELYAFYRDLYKRVSTQDINDYAQTYRGSREEAADLLELYGRFKGHMKQVFAWQVCSDAAQDSHRFRDIIRGHCKESGAKEHPAFAKWAKGVDSKPAPKEPLKPRNGGSEAAGSEQAPVAAMRSRAQERGRATLGALEAKYCKPSPGKRKRGSRPAAAEDAEVAPEADAVDSTPSKPERRKARGKGKAAQ